MIKKLYIILFFIPFALFSQISDLEIWSSVNISHKLNKRNEINFEQSLRTFQNSSNWNTIFSEISYSHDFNKYISVGVAYRFSIENKLDYSLNNHRLFPFLQLKKKINDFAFSYRFALQTEYSGINRQEGWQTPKSYNRHQLKVKYKFTKKILPFFSYELYYLLSNEFYFTDKYRLTGGINYKFNKNNSLKVFYRYQRVQYNSKINLYIIGISFKYNL
jgi:hypothetical protein